MATVIKTPALGQAIANVRIVEWLVQEGQKIRLGDPLLEVDTDKMAMEVPCEVSGFILKILCPAGSDAPEGTALVVIGDEGEDISELLEQLSNDS